MKTLLLVPLIVGLTLIYLGIREEDNRLKSADERMGGSILAVLGVSVVVITFITAFIVFIFS